MNFELVFDKNVELPTIRCDDDVQGLVCIFIAADIGRSNKIIDLILRKVKKSIKNKDSRDSYQGEICTLVLKEEVAIVEDNGLIFEEPTSFEMSIVEFEKLLKSWETFVQECGCLLD